MPTEPAAAPPAGTSTAAPTDAPTDPVLTAVERWQRELGELGGPNSLLWFDEQRTVLELTHAHPGGLAIFLTDRPTLLSEMVRERTAFVDAVARARRIRDKAAALREEHGITTMFLAAGLATIPAGARTVRAPVLLRTVELEPVDGSDRDLRLVVGDGIEVNPALVDLLAHAGVTIDAPEIAAAARTRSGFDPSRAHLALQAEAHAGGLQLPVEQRLLVTTFTYSKAALAADLATNGKAWTRHPVLRAAAGEEGERAHVLPSAEPDADLATERLVLDLDTTQARVVAAARAGTDLVVDAPAGTGATQTVAATLAALAGDGRSTLLASSSRHELRSTVERLAQVGLDGLVLAVDDDPRTRERALGDILASIDAPAVSAPDVDVRQVSHLRDRLAGHHEALHARREPWGVSAFEAQAAIATLHEAPQPPTSRVRLDPDTLAATSRDRAVATGTALAEAARRGAWRGGRGRDPWFGARITSPEEARLAAVVLRRLTGDEGLDRAERLVRAVYAEAHLAPAETVPGWRADLDDIASVGATAEVFTPEVYDAPLPEMLSATSSAFRTTHGPAVGLWRRMTRRRQATALLRPGNPPADLHTELAAAHTQATLWRERSGPAARPHPATGVDAARGAVDGVRADLAWLAPRLQGTAMGDAIEELPVDDLRRHLRRLLGAVERAQVVPVVGPTLDAARAGGFGALLDELARRDVAPEHVAAEVEFVWWSSVLDAIRASDPRYGEHDAAALRRTRDQYRDADRALLVAAADVIRRDVGAAARSAAERHPDQVEALRAELATGTGVRPLAELWSLAPDVLAAARPVWACAPEVVPTIAPAHQRFDTVVVLGAQSVTPAVAAAAVGRGRSVLVVGDPNGIPPIPFTVAAGMRGIEDDITVARVGSSLLDALRERLPGVALRVAYGRRDARLDEPVAGVPRLVHVPAVGGPTPVSIERVPAPQDDSDLVSPTAEVERVVRLVLAHARSRGERSLAVITLAEEHAERIADALQRELDALAPDSVEALGLAALPEPFVVLPVHRLSGRVRDDVLLAPGYAVAGGPPPHRFGVVALPGGERLVSVAAGAARRSLTVVTSLTCADLGPAREPVDGVARLRALLDAVESAQERIATRAPQQAARPTDPLLRDLMTRLTGHGLTARPGVGEPGRSVDLAVSRPRRPHDSPVAVSTDGTGTAALKGARERERLWPELLADRGWVPVAVSTIDLFEAPEPEAARIAAAAEGRA